MTTVIAKKAVDTGLVRRPTFEEVIRYKNPKVHIPFRQAWFERNSHHLSQFDGGEPDEAEGLLSHLRAQADERHAHAAMQHMYQGRGMVYLAQGAAGGPPAFVPFNQAPAVQQQERAEGQTFAQLMATFMAALERIQGQQGMGQALDADDEFQSAGEEELAEGQLALLGNRPGGRERLQRMAGAAAGGVGYAMGAAGAVALRGGGAAMRGAGRAAAITGELALMGMEGAADVVATYGHRAARAFQQFLFMNGARGIRDARWVMDLVRQDAPIVMGALRQGARMGWQMNRAEPHYGVFGPPPYPIGSLSLTDVRRDPERAHALDMQQRLALRDEDLDNVEAMWRREDGTYGPPGGTWTDQPSYLDALADNYRPTRGRSRTRPAPLGRFARNEAQRLAQVGVVEREVERIEAANRGRAAAATLRLMDRSGSGI